MGVVDKPGVCELHSSHYPEPLEVEQHHVIPVSWQQIEWQPETPPYPGTDPDGRGPVWDSRRIPVPPTCHRNVHHWIVLLMHALTGEDPQQAFAAVKGEKGGTQAHWALEALVRFKEAGGTLQQLVAAKEWGES
jgi:hypothetical protein